MWMDRKRTNEHTNGQMNGRNYTNFETNLAMMVIYVPVKFKFDWTNNFRVRVQKQKCGRTDGWTDKLTKNRQTDRQTNGRNYTNFERNLAMMVIYVPVKYEFDWTNRFRVRVGKRKSGRTDGWTDKKRTNEQTNRQMNGRNYTNFERNLAMMVIYVPVKYEFDWTNRFQVRVGKRKCGRTDGWTDKKRTNERTNGQMNGRNYTNFERNLAMMVIYVPVKFKFDWTNNFRVRVQKQTCGRTDGWTDILTKNGQTDRQTNGRNYTNFERNLAMMVIYLLVKFEFDWTKYFQVRVRKQKC